MRLTAEQVEVILQASKDAIRSKEILERMEKLKLEIECMRNEVILLFGGRDIANEFTKAIRGVQTARDEINYLNASISAANNRIKEAEQAAFQNIKEIEADFRERMEAKILAMRSEFGP